MERVPEAATILRGLRSKAGIIDDKSDIEICSLQEIYNCWEALAEKSIQKENGRR